jgi:S-adenosylmethionine hydrolase
LHTITLISDFGEGSHYIARVKASIYAEVGFVPILDISHSIPAWDIEKGAFILNATRKRVKGEVFHFFGINNHTTQFLLAKSEKHWFLAPDNGVLPAILQHEAVTYFDLGAFQHHSFMERLYPQVLSMLMENTFPLDARKVLSPNKVQFKTPSVNQNALYVYLIYTDNYGNAHYNIKREEFYAQFGHNGFRILLNEKDYIDKLSESYFDVSQTNLLAIFNAAGYLEISVCMGNANRLFGLDKTGYILIIPSS